MIDQTLMLRVHGYFLAAEDAGRQHFSHTVDAPGGPCDVGAAMSTALAILSGALTRDTPSDEFAALADEGGRLAAEGGVSARLLGDTVREVLAAGDAYCDSHRSN